jgi:hypothetical protein
VSGSSLPGLLWFWDCHNHRYGEGLFFGDGLFLPGIPERVSSLCNYVKKNEKKTGRYLKCFGNSGYLRIPTLLAGAVSPAHLLKILLVILFCFPELRCRNDLGCNRSAPVFFRCRKPGLRCLGLFLLLR